MIISIFGNVQNVVIKIVFQQLMCMNPKKITEKNNRWLLDHKVEKYYIAFKRIKNFVCLEVHPQNAKIVHFLKIDPDTITLEDQFSRDVRNIGHSVSNGDPELTIYNDKDFEKATRYIHMSCDVS